MSIVFTKYMHWLDKKPLMTKCSTSAILVGLGDQIAQAMERKFDPKKKPEVQRTLNFMFYGLVANGPALHFTYASLIPKIAPSSSYRCLAKKLLFTQTLFSLVSISSFYIFVS